MKNNTYYDTLEHEVFFSVYYYHNKINNIDLHTVGCELSEWDGERIVETLLETNKDDIIVVNTCAVTEWSQLATEKVVDRLSKIYPDKKMYIVGCGVNYNPDYYKKYGTCIPNEDKFKTSVYGHNNNSLYKKFKHNVQGNNTGLIKIQDGCHNKCAYCAINLLRKNPYSLPFDDICKQVEELLREGKNEICLIGTEICTYNDNGMRVAQVCQELLDKYPGIKSISMGALDPASPQIEEILDLVKSNDRMHKVLYLSTQSGSDTILKLMNRRHTVKRMEDIVKYAEGKVFFSWHVICGFPGETEELWKETLDTLYRLKPVGVDVMPFSARKGTPAYDMVNNNDKETIDRRVKECYAALDKCYLNDLCPVDIESLERKEYSELTDRNKFYPTFNAKIFELNDVKKEDLNQDIIIKSDLYKDEDLIKLFHLLDLTKSYENVTIMTDYYKDKNNYDLEINIKMLVFNFGVKVLSNIYLTNKLVNDILSDEFNLRDFIVYSNTFIRLIPAEHNIENISQLIDKLRDENLYDVTKLYEML